MMSTFISTQLSHRRRLQSLHGQVSISDGSSTIGSGAQHKRDEESHDYRYYTIGVVRKWPLSNSIENRQSRILRQSSLGPLNLAKVDAKPLKTFNKLHKSTSPKPLLSCDNSFPAVVTLSSRFFRMLYLERSDNLTFAYTRLCNYQLLHSYSSFTEIYRFVEISVISCVSVPRPSNDLQ